MMVSLSQTVKVLAGTAGLAFIGYCIYFDRKRRSDPKYQEKLRERRQKKRGAAGARMSRTNDGSSRKRPDPTDDAACQAYFLSEIQEGEAKLATGMIDEGIEHMVNAVGMCGQPHQLLQVLQQTLPPQIFQKLLQQLTNIEPRAAQSGPVIEEADDDIE